MERVIRGAAVPAVAVVAGRKDEPARTQNINATVNPGCFIFIVLLVRLAFGFGIFRSFINYSKLPEFRLAERVRRECAATGLWFAAHPLDALLPADAERDAVPGASLEEHTGRAVTVVGMPCASRRVETKNGEPMLFLTVADRSGLAECVLFPDTYRAFADAARGSIVRVEGRVDVALDAVTLGVSRCIALA